MIDKNKYLILKFFNIFKHLILYGFLAFFFYSCDYFSQKNLLTFYYHFEDSQKNLVINKLIKQFQKNNDISIKAFPYYIDEFHKVMKNKDSPYDIIEIDYSNIFDDGLINNSLKLDSVFNKNYIFKNRFYQWLKDYYFIFKNKNLIKHEQNFILPLSDDKANYSEFLNLTQNKKIFGIPINNNQNTIHFLLCLSYLYNLELSIVNDSISLGSPQIKKIFSDLIRINAVSFLGTQNEIEKNFDDGQLVYFLGNTNYLKKYHNRAAFDYYPVSNNSNHQYSYYKSFLAINNKSKNLKNALNFLKFLTSDSVLNQINDLVKYKLDLNQESHNSKSLQLFENKYYYEINKCLVSILIEQDTTLYSLAKTEQKINKMLKYRKHISYK